MKNILKVIAGSLGIILVFFSGGFAYFIIMAWS
jgi:hypothetical protein